jgi:hypothetical protein
MEFESHVVALNVAGIVGSRGKSWYEVSKSLVYDSACLTSRAPRAKRET